VTCIQGNVQYRKKTRKINHNYAGSRGWIIFTVNEKTIKSITKGTCHRIQDKTIILILIEKSNENYNRSRTHQF
jgi:hypothetical protein